MNKLTPYLMFDGTCEKAMNFYADCFKGTISFMQKYKDAPMDTPEEHQDKVMHTELRFLDTSIMASDNMPSVPYTTASDGSNVHLSLYVEESDQAFEIFEKLGQDGNITMPMAKQFWGDTFGMVTDQFGIKWMMVTKE